MVKRLAMAAMGAMLSLGAGMTAATAGGDGPRPVNAFFAMDNGVGRGTWTAQQQAQTVKELGYDGIGYNYTTPQAAAQWQRELHQRGLKLFSLYVYAFPDKPDAQRYPPGLRQTIEQLKGSETIIWMTLRETKDRKKTGYDDACVKIVNEVADWAKPSGLKVAIYPHMGFYVATAEEALRIVKRVDRPDVGVTLNLCHELMQNNADRLPQIARQAAQQLFLVTINGADAGGKPRGYIQPLGQGRYDVCGFLKMLKEIGYQGPIGLQCYAVKGDVRQNLEKSMAVWRKYQSAISPADQGSRHTPGADADGTRRVPTTYNAARIDPSDLERLGISAGLCIQVGCDDTGLAVSLARTGRFLVQVLDGDGEAVDRVRQSLQSQPWYGLVSVARLNSANRLPYAENLVNLAVVRPAVSIRVAWDEVARVLCPGGVVLTRRDGLDEAAWRAAGLEELRGDAVGRGWWAGRKPWPAGMDQWTYSCGAADGNTVSHDTLVGPPRRVRWIAGPAEEISSMVSAEGRNFYGGVWTRDAFNGLPLWQQSLRPSPAQGGFGFSYTPGSVRPIAAGSVLIVTSNDMVCALDGATGARLRTYPEAGRPTALLHVQGKLLAVDSGGLRALEVQSGRLVWKYATAAEPRLTVATDRSVVFLEGNPRRGEKPQTVCLELASGKVAWKQTEYPWTPLVRRIVAHDDLVVFEVSTLADKKEGNAIHVASLADGKLLWSRQYVPGMNHMKQARAMFIGDALWILEYLQCVGLDPHTGEVKRKFPAGLCHWFPPVATSRFMFSGEMSLTDLATGEVDAQRITKAACSRDFGWIPANGLIYTSPKHCVCWPMLRGYTALAPESSQPAVDEAVEHRRFVLEKGCDPPAWPPGLRGGVAGRAVGERPAGDRLAAVTPLAPAATPAGGSDAETDWPCYRHDAWRSGATSADAPAALKPRWTVSLGKMPEGTIAQDWRENPFVHGPITAPVAAGGLAYVARPDAHQVVAIDLKTGQVRWRITVEGRVDTPPTIHRGLCLFGTRCGWVYCLRAEDGRMVWRLRAAPTEEQIVAYGQIESPWPVPGSVLVVGDVAYFAAGRQPLADGGILLFAAEPATGRLRWVKRLDSLSMTNFYGSAGLDFDNFDLLQREGESVAMSRWRFDRRTGEMVAKAAGPFARLGTGAGPGVVVQRGLWSYAPRHQPRFDASELWPRPLAVFRANMLIGCLPNQRTLFRRDFNAEALRQFDMTWITGWAAAENFSKKKGDVWPVDRLAKNARWSSPLLEDAAAGQRIAALALAGRQLLVAGSRGGLQVLSLDDGSLVGRADLAAPLWDGIAIAPSGVLVSTAEGDLVCLGSRSE